MWGGTQGGEAAARGLLLQSAEKKKKDTEADCGVVWGC